MIRVAFSPKPSTGDPLKLGFRVLRVNTKEWLDPADPSGLTWRSTPPVNLWEASPISAAYGADAAGTPLAGRTELAGHQAATIPEAGFFLDKDGKELDLPSVTLVIGVWRVLGQPGLDPNSALVYTEYPQAITVHRNSPAFPDSIELIPRVFFDVRPSERR